MASSLVVGTHVGKVRLAVATDTPGVRTRAFGALQRAEIHPSSVPPAAVLVVRHMGDPLPGGVSTSGGELALDASWQQAARATLGNLAASAARPVFGPVSASAAAVLFSDRAELVACLLTDMVAGVVYHRWWWDCIVGQVAPHGRPAELMEREAVVVPAALRLVEAPAEVINTLTDDEARRVLASLASAHGMASASMGEPLRGGPPALPDTGSEGGAESPAAEPHHRAPWSDWLPPGTVPASLTAPQALVLGTALLLHVRGAEARREEYWEIARRWSAQHSDATPAGRPVDEERIQPQSLEADGGRPHASAGGLRTVGSPGSPDPGVAPSIAPGVVLSTHPGSGHEPTPPVTAAAANVLEPEAISSPAGDSAPSAAASDAPPEPTAVTTRLAGVMYLIQLNRRLGLPQCFEEGWRLDSEVGAWGLVEALGRVLTHGVPDGDSDPLWDLLAELAGRSTEEPLGAGVPQSQDYEMPVAWWHALSGTDHRFAWGARGGRLRTWTDTGLILTETAGDGGAAPALRALAPYGAAAPPRRARFDTVALMRPSPRPIPNVAGAFGHWLDLAMPAIRKRLVADLDVGVDEVAPILLLAEGRILTTRTHVDVIFPLDAASVTVRRSGLDRDPGWVPELGRVVTFHFE